MAPQFRRLAACILILSLAACGGGDVGDTSGPQVSGNGTLSATLTPVAPPGQVQSLTSSMVEAGIGLIDEGEDVGAPIPLPRPASLFADLGIGIQFPATGAFLDIEIVNYSRQVLGVPITKTEPPPSPADRNLANRGMAPILRAVWYPEGLGQSGKQYDTMTDPGTGSITVTKLTGGELVAVLDVTLLGQIAGDTVRIQTTQPLSAFMGTKTAPRAFVAAIVSGTTCYSFGGTAPCDSVAVGQPIVFDVSESDDVDGTVVRWRIDYADGTAPEDYTFSTTKRSNPHSFAAVGNYDVKVWVEDNDGLQSPLILTPPATTPVMRVVVQ